MQYLMFQLKMVFQAKLEVSRVKSYMETMCGVEEGLERVKKMRSGSCDFKCQNWWASYQKKEFRSRKGRFRS